MKQNKDLTMRILRVIWVLGIIGFIIVLCMFTYLGSLGEGLSFGLLIGILFSTLYALAFTIIMLCTQYIFLSTFSVKKLFS